MPLKQLPKEVWTSVAACLRRPVGRPGEVKDRKDLRQIDLVNLMCTSKLLNNAAAPILYHTVVCDDLAALFHNYTEQHPVCPGILKKKTLLRLTRALYLEYPIRNLVYGSSTRFFILNVKHWGPVIGDFWGIRGSFTNAPQCATLIDCEELFVQQPTTQLQNSMPDLETLSCSTLFGGYVDGWLSSFGGTMSFLAWVGDTQKVFTRMFLRGRIKHFCQSSIYSPMCIHPVELYKCKSDSATPTPVDVERTITMHISLKSIKFKDVGDILSTSCTMPNAQVRWCFDEPRNTRAGDPQPLLGFADSPPLLRAVLLALVHGLADRDNSKARSGAYDVLPFNFEAYIPLTDAAATMLLQGSKVHNPPQSTAKEKRHNKGRLAASRVSDAVCHELFETDVEASVLHPDDKFALRYIADCPACPACAWTPTAL